MLFYSDLDGGVRLRAVAVSDVDVSGFGNAGVEVGAWNASWSGFASTSVSGVTAHDYGDVGISTFGFFRPRSRQYSLTDVTVVGSTAYGGAGIAGKGSDSGSGIEVGGACAARSAPTRPTATAPLTTRRPARPGSSSGTRRRSR